MSFDAFRQKGFGALLTAVVLVAGCAPVIVTAAMKQYGERERPESPRSIAIRGAQVAHAPRTASAKNTDEQLFHEKRPAMGSAFEIHLYAASREQAEAAFNEAFEEVERVEALLSNYRPSSELSRINQRAKVESVITDPEVFAFIQRGLMWSQRSEGAFDMTVGRLMKAWGFFRGQGRLPAKAEIEEIRQTIGWQRVQLDERARAVRFLAASIELDPGGIGKGYTLDRIVAVLRESGVRAALIDAGGSSLYALGAPPGEKGWKVNVPEPLDRQRTLSTVWLRDQSLSTSGNYEKFFELHGHKYCHIMNPQTGYPVEGMLQTTVITPEGIDSDALSTALFVMGPAAGQRMLEKLPGQPPALFVTDQKGERRVVKFRWETVARD